jgi:hypothetical protein
MRKILLIISSLFIGFSNANSQTSIQLSNNSAGGIILNNDIIYEDVTTGGQSHIYIALKNIGSSQKTFALKRTDVVLNAGADAYFCFGGQCFPTTTTMTPADSYVTLDPDQLDTPQSLYYDENMTEGYSEIKYELFDVNNTSDLLTFTFKFNPLLASVKNNTSLLSSISEIYPNPSINNAQITLNSKVNTKEATINITNSLGAIVSTKNIPLSVGKNVINLNFDNLSSGIYFATISYMNTKNTKKFTINK